jgi:ATP-dependent DNA helicase RecG
MLRFVDLQRDAWLIAAVKDLAHDLLQNEPQLASKHLVRWLGSRTELLKA